MNIKKVLLTGTSMALVAAVAVAGTVAYLTDEKQVVNTFTAGDVSITLDEAVVEQDENGNYVAVDSGERDEDGQEYKLLPGQTICKDPTITIAEDSENAYVAAKVTITGDIYDLIGVEGYDNIDITQLASGGLMNDASTQQFDWNGLSMVYAGDTYAIYQEADAANRTWVLYVFVEEAQAAEAEVTLFDTITVPADYTNEDIEKLATMEITVDGYAVQASGFDSCFDAMTSAFGGEDGAFNFE
ncbi:MAG: hypothetical protein IJO29_07160 [Oscillospiraceae bacterium]|nr:hypothetical protein [Oscillospiraceae bacterium]